MAEGSIERRILIGLISSGEYIGKIRKVCDPALFQSKMASRISEWCLEYYDKYGRAPGLDIEGIYFDKLKAGLPKDIAEEIAEDILPDLSEEYVSTALDVSYLTDQTIAHFHERTLLTIGQGVLDYVEKGKLTDATELITTYSPVTATGLVSPFINLADPTSRARIRKAFAEGQKPLFTYPGALGTFWNHQLVRGGFIALMGSEKRGKSYWLLDMAVRASRQGVPVIFFQAGDMTESQQLRRLCIHLAKRSDMNKYCGVMHEPTKDCIHNQRDTCTKGIRECSFGVFPAKTEKELRTEITFDDLKEALIQNPDYAPCYNCSEYKTKNWGTPWLTQVDVGGALEEEEAVLVTDKFFSTVGRNFYVATYPNDSLTLTEMRAVLKQLPVRPGFILVDYADLMVPAVKGDHRHGQNSIWKGLRAIGQEEDTLLVTVTQADALSYEKNTLSMKNFSEDKRKYGHVTAMYGLNQDSKSREKKIGVMRLNELVMREGYFDTTNTCHVLQNLARGLPFITSYL